MVPVPAINGGLHLAGRDGGHDGPGGLGVVCLAGCVFVQWGEVHNSPGRPVVLWGDQLRQFIKVFKLHVDSNSI